MDHPVGAYVHILSYSHRTRLPKIGTYIGDSSSHLSWRLTAHFWQRVVYVRRVCNINVFSAFAMSTFCKLCRSACRELYFAHWQLQGCPIKSKLLLNYNLIGIENPLIRLAFKLNFSVKEAPEYYQLQWSIYTEWPKK